MECVDFVDPKLASKFFPDSEKPVWAFEAPKKLSRIEEKVYFRVKKLSPALVYSKKKKKIQLILVKDIREMFNMTKRKKEQMLLL